MYPKIAIISAAYSQDNIAPIISEFKNKCKIELMPYHQLNEAISIYNSCYKDFDGFLFSGWLPYSVVMGLNEYSDKPHAYFNISEGDFFKTMFMIAKEHPGIDFRRVMVDDPQLNIDFTEIFKNNDSFIINSSYSLEFAMMEASSISVKNSDVDSYLSQINIYNIAMESYRAAIKANNIDIIVTRVGNLAPFLEKENIPYYLLSPSRSTMIETLENFINTICSGIAVDTLVVHGLIVPHNIVDKSNINEFVKILVGFNRRNGMNLFVREVSGKIELTTSNKYLKKLTNNFTGCQLSDYISRNTDKPFNIGWGVGYDVMQAAEHAQKALKLSEMDNHYAYIVNEAKIEIGPLSSEDCLKYTPAHDDIAKTLSKKHELPPLTIKRLLYFLDKHPNESFASNDIALGLEMSQRNARRILSILVKTGGAKCIENVVTGERGRPSPKYEIKLL